MQVPTRKAPCPVTGVFIRREKFGPRHLEKVSGEDGARHLGARVPWGVPAATKSREEACSRFLLLPLGQASSSQGWLSGSGSQTFYQLS